MKVLNIQLIIFFCRQTTKAKAIYNSVYALVAKSFLKQIR